MTTKEALLSETNYPIQGNVIERIGVQRDLDTSLEFSIDISVSVNYNLALADTYMYIARSFDNLKDQDVSLSKVDRNNLLREANLLYSKYDPTFVPPFVIGYVGEEYNA